MIYYYLIFSGGRFLSYEVSGQTYREKKVTHCNIIAQGQILIDEVILLIDDFGPFNIRPCFRNDPTKEDYALTCVSAIGFYDVFHNGRGIANG